MLNQIKYTIEIEVNTPQAVQNADVVKTIGNTLTEGMTANLGPDETMCVKAFKGRPELPEVDLMEQDDTPSI